MLTRIRKAQQTQNEQDQGFTLIELLVVVVIIGILAVIAIPTFLAQREKAWTRSVESDLRNSATVVEQWFNEKGTYGGAPGSTTTGTTTTAVAWKTSKDVSLTPATLPTTMTNSYCITGTHASLPGKSWVLKSELGRPMEVGTATGQTTAC